jgi:hypothetical protein
MVLGIGPSTERYFVRKGKSTLKLIEKAIDSEHENPTPGVEKRCYSGNARIGQKTR